MGATVQPAVSGPCGAGGGPEALRLGRANASISVPVETVPVRIFGPGTTEFVIYTSHYARCMTSLSFLKGYTCVYLGYDMDIQNQNVCAWYILLLSI